MIFTHVLLRLYKIHSHVFYIFSTIFADDALRLLDAPAYPAGLRHRLSRMRDYRRS
jgi:hypothetical protein